MECSGLDEIDQNSFLNNEMSIGIGVGAQV